MYRDIYVCRKIDRQTDRSKSHLCCSLFNTIFNVQERLDLLCNFRRRDLLIVKTLKTSFKKPMSNVSPF